MTGSAVWILSVPASTIDLVSSNGKPKDEFLRQDLRARVPLFNT